MKLTIHHFESLPSTQDYAHFCIAEKEGEGVVIVADAQTKGRGQFDRTWQSPKGNLYVSVVLHPPSHDKAPAPSCYGQLAILAGLSVYQGIHEALNSSDGHSALEHLQLKWPNDGHVNDQKLFGVLVEVFEGHVIVGFGVNVNTMPDQVDRPVMCLQKLLGAVEALDLTPLLHGVLKNLFANYKVWLKGDFEPIRSAWEQYGHAKGALISRKQPDGSVVKGAFLGLNADGAMRLQDDRGEEITVVSVAHDDTHLDPDPIDDSFDDA